MTAHAHGAHGGGAHGGTAHGAHGGAPDREPAPGETPAEFWERRYGGERVWSGRVNDSLAAVVEVLDADAADPRLPRPRSLDLGCGEGGDVLWLAERGWEATGIELSPSAVERGRAAAAERGQRRARFIVADLAEWVRDPVGIDGSRAGFDLVTASFLQSPVELPRAEILRAAAARVADGGHLVVVSHAAPPPWAADHPGDFPSPEGELEMLGLAPEEWGIVVAEVRSRVVPSPDGGGAELEDTVVVLRRGA